MIFTVSVMFTYSIKFTLMERNPAICDNMNEPGRPYAKWNKPDPEKLVLYDLTYM